MRMSDWSSDVCSSDLQSVHRQCLTHTRVQLPGIVYGHRRIVAPDVHAEFERGVGNLDADRTQTNDTERAARKFKHDKLLLAGFDRLMHRLVVALQLPDQSPRPRNLSPPPTPPPHHPPLT